jgi:mannosyltransferase OCH1-like enzyme
MVSCSSRRVLAWFLTLLAVFLLGTVVVLATVREYFGVDPRDIIDPVEVDLFESLPSLPYNTSLSDDVIDDGSGDNTDIIDDDIAREKVPRIIHQTWKTDVLPERWQVVRQKCMAMHPE